MLLYITVFVGSYFEGSFLENCTVGIADAMRIEIRKDIAFLTFTRPEKRNAMNDDLVGALEAFFSAPPDGVNVAILSGEGGHFCSGLDLSEHEDRSPVENLHHSRNWHRVAEMIEMGPLPVVALLTGAVIGGGLEIATCAHVRIAEPNVIFQLPEGRRGIFVGGGATMRVARIIGHDRMREMMLTGRKYNSDEGQALGLTHYSVGEGEGMELANKLANKIADNAPMSNYLMMQAIRRIQEMPHEDGLFTESLAASFIQSTEGAKEGLRAFLEKRLPVFRKRP